MSRDLYRLVAVICTLPPLVAFADKTKPVRLELVPPAKPVVYHAMMRHEETARGRVATTTSEGRVVLDFSKTPGDTIAVVMRFENFADGTVMAGKAFEVEYALRGLILDAAVSRRGELVRCLARDNLGRVANKLVSRWIEDFFVPFPDAEVGVDTEWLQKLSWEPMHAKDPRLAGEMSYRITHLRSTARGMIAKIEGSGSYDASWPGSRGNTVRLNVKREEKLEVSVASGVVTRGRIEDDYSWDDRTFSGMRRFDFELAPDDEN